MVSDNTILGLDIGTSKICAAAGIPQSDGTVRFIAHSEQKSEGVRAGHVNNLETVIKTIKSVIEDVELAAGIEVKQIVTGVSGSHIEGLFSQGVVGIKSKDQEIRKEDIYRSMEVARAFELPLDREILHTLVQDFCIDGRSGIKDPVDMIGHRLETKVMIVTGSVAVSQNIDKCFERLQYKAKRRVLQQLADAEAVLSAEEREMGTLLIDMGAGMTNMIGFVHGSPIFVGGVNIGGDQVTADLTYILNQPLSMVEEVKREFGCCYEPIVSHNESVIIPQVGDQPSIRLPKRELCKIIEPRVAEVFAMLREMLEKRGLLHAFGGGIVITGGGAMMPGAPQLAAELFDIPARKARFGRLPGFEDGFSDLGYSTAIGLVLYDAHRQSNNETKNHHRQASPTRETGLAGRIKNLFDVLF
ncbi:MAG: cell division protein FtsA [Spirochaetia bacterium]|nr:cell division protein FtsA [Spirochaetia bacterium]MCF7941050.1 cell division protein FtsA [Spirochaetia bacterium]